MSDVTGEDARDTLAEALTTLRADRDGNLQPLSYYRRWSEVEADAIAPIVARLLADARAEALRDAAEEFATGAWQDAWATAGVHDDVSAVRATEAWFLARADREATTRAALDADEGGTR